MYEKRVALYLFFFFLPLWCLCLTEKKSCPATDPLCGAVHCRRQGKGRIGDSFSSFSWKADEKWASHEGNIKYNIFVLISVKCNLKTKWLFFLIFIHDIPNTSRTECSKWDYLYLYFLLVIFFPLFFWVICICWIS